MSTIYDLVRQQEGMGLYMGQYGYAQLPETALLTFDMYTLNKDNLDFRSAALKNVATKVSVSENGEQIKWYEQDLKKALITITGVTSATQFTVSATDVIIGEELFNQATNETVIVQSAAGSSITVYAPGFTGSAYAINNKLVRMGFAKLYGQNNGLLTGRQDLQQYDNYLQIGERTIDSDLIENNQLYLLIGDANKRAAMVFGDASRDILKEIAINFYVGVKGKNANSGTFLYTTGGLLEFIPTAAKVNIKGVDPEDTKRKLRNELTKAYQSGVDGIWGNNKLLAFCTTKFADMIDSLYESKIYYQDKLKAIDVNITTYSVGGKKLNLVVSNTLDYAMGDQAACFLVPIDYAFLHIFPHGPTAETGKTVESYGRGVVYAKPRTTWEKQQLGLWTMYSFMFLNVSSGAYRFLKYE